MRLDQMVRFVRRKIEESDGMFTDTQIMDMLADYEAVLEESYGKPVPRSKKYELSQRKNLTRAADKHLDKARDLIWELMYHSKKVTNKQILEAMFELLVGCEQMKHYLKHDTNWHIDDSGESIKKIYS